MIGPNSNVIGWRDINRSPPQGNFAKSCLHFVNNYYMIQWPSCVVHYLNVKKTENWLRKLIHNFIVHSNERACRKMDDLVCTKSLIASPAFLYSGKKRLFFSWKPMNSLTTCFFYQVLIGHWCVILLLLSPPSHLRCIHIYSCLIK